MEFKIGDKVQLNSGGPVMTISKIVVKDNVGNTRAEIVECIWFDREDKGPHMHNFHKESLSSFS